VDNRGVYPGGGKECEVTKMNYREGPWDREFSMTRETSRPSDPYRPHPVLAPLAWVICLIAGVAFWIAVYRFVF
jgi:hypothetical protein